MATADSHNARPGRIVTQSDESRFDMRRVLAFVLGLVAVGYCSVLIGWFLEQPVPALQDLGEWNFQSWALYRMLSGDATVLASFSIHPTLVPNLLFPLLSTASTALFGSTLSAKILITAYCIAAVLVCYNAAIRFSHTTPVPTFVLLLALVGFNSCFWHGYMNYQVGLLIMVSYLSRSAEPEPSPMAIFGYSAALYACHASMWIAFVVLITVKEWRRTDRLQIGLALLPTMLLFSLYLLHPHAAGGGNGGSNNPVTSIASFAVYKAYTLAKTGTFQNLVGPDGRAAVVTPWLYRSGIAINLLFAATTLTVLLVGLRKSFKSRVDLRAMMIFWAVLAVLFVTIPADMAEVVNLGERFLYLLLASLVITLPYTRLRDAAAVIAACGLMLTVAQLPRVSLSGTDAPEAVHHAPEETGRAYAADGLFSHRLYQNDERRVELRDGVSQFAPLLFDTWLLRNREPRVAAALPAKL